MGSTMNPPERPRAVRKPFIAAIVITDMLSEQQISSRTSDLSVSGCFVPTPTPLNPGVKVRIAIVYAGAKVVAFGRVGSARANGMSVAFTEIEQRDQDVLEQWLSDLRVREE
jgi:hypothetical protein